VAANFSALPAVAGQYTPLRIVNRCCSGFSVSFGV